MTKFLAQLPDPFPNGQITDKYPLAQLITETQENRRKVSVFQPQSLKNWTGNQYGVVDKLEDSDRISKLLPLLASSPFFTPNNEGFIELWEEQPTKDSFTQPVSSERTLNRESTRTIIERVSETASATNKTNLPVANSEIVKLESTTVNQIRLDAPEQIESNQRLETLTDLPTENSLQSHEVTVLTESDVISATGFNSEPVNVALNSNPSIIQKFDDSETSSISPTSSLDLSTTHQDTFNTSIENQFNTSELIEGSQPSEVTELSQVSKSGQLNHPSTNPTSINPNPQIFKNSGIPPSANLIESPITVNSENFDSTTDRPLATPEITTLLNPSNSFDKSSVSQDKSNQNNNQEDDTVRKSEISADFSQFPQSLGNPQESLEINPIAPIVPTIEVGSSIQSPEDSKIENPISSEQSLIPVSPLISSVIDESTTLQEKAVQTFFTSDQSQSAIATNKEKFLEIVQPNSVVTPSVLKEEDISVNSNSSIEPIPTKESQSKKLSEFSVSSPEQSTLSHESVIQSKLSPESESKVSGIYSDHLIPISSKEETEVNLLNQSEITIKEQNASVSQNYVTESLTPQEPKRSRSSVPQNLINPIVSIKTFSKTIADLIQPLSNFTKDFTNTQSEIQPTNNTENENIVTAKTNHITAQQSTSNLNKSSVSNESDRREGSQERKTETLTDFAQSPQLIEHPISSQQSLTEVSPLIPSVIDKSRTLQEKAVQTFITSDQSQPAIATNKEKFLEVVQPNIVVTSSIPKKENISVNSSDSIPNEPIPTKESHPKALSEFSVFSPKQSSLSHESVIQSNLPLESKSEVSVTSSDYLTSIKTKDKHEANLLSQAKATIKDQNVSVSQNSALESSSPEESKRSPSHSSQSLINQIFPIKAFSKTVADPIKAFPDLPKDSNNIESEINPTENAVNEKNLILENPVVPRQIEQSLAITPQTSINPIMPVSSIQREAASPSETSQKIVVTIGHIDVKVTHSNPPNKPNPQPPTPSGPRLSLAEYLRRQNHPERGRS